MELKYFKPDEFACKCGKCGLGIESMDDHLLLMLDSVRAAIGEPIRINSAVRCADHNRAVGGSAKSEHVPENTDTGKCTAVDIHIPNSGFMYKLLCLLFYMHTPRIGINFTKNFVHVGCSKNHPQHVVFSY